MKGDSLLMDNIKREIEVLRMELESEIEGVSDKGELTGQRLLELSERLDVLINKYIKNDEA